MFVNAAQQFLQVFVCCKAGILSKAIVEVIICPPFHPPLRNGPPFRCPLRNGCPFLKRTSVSKIFCPFRNGHWSVGVRFETYGMNPHYIIAITYFCTFVNVTDQSIDKLAVAHLHFMLYF